MVLRFFRSSMKKGSKLILLTMVGPTLEALMILIGFSVIFCSNDDPIFGQVSLGNSNQPWLSSKNVTGTPEKSSPSSMDSLRLGLGASRSTSGHFEVKTEYLQDQDQFFIHGYGKMSYLTSHAQRNVHASVNQVDNAGGKSISVAKEKV
ncbi:hypothetical protein CsSME_00011386 [Camellia sinensis var. sinensis]